MRFTAASVVAMVMVTAPAGGIVHAATPSVQAADKASPAALASCKGREGYAAAAGGARNLLWRPEWLALQKADLARDAERAGRLRTLADAALGRGPYSVRDKADAAASGDLGDYVSIGPYWWPNPEAPDGLPYVRRDGQTNPERDGERFDSKRLEAMTDDVMLLSLAGHYLGDPRYSEHAAALVRTWFIDPGTRMNPNLVYAQAVPGLSSGRSFGVIDAVRLIEVAESVSLLEARGAINKADSAAVRNWYGDLAHWMTTSENGRAAAATVNNHSLYFDLMLAHFSLFAGREGAASEVSRVYGERRLAQQLDTTGGLPHELARSRPWSYSVFALKAALQMAMLGDCLGADLWDWRAPDGKNLRQAVDFLVSHRRKNLEEWGKPDLDLADPVSRARVLREADQLFRLAAWGWRDPAISSDGANDYLIPGYGR